MLLTTLVTIDYETYLTLDGNVWQGTALFASLTNEICVDVKYISYLKSPKKVFR